MPLYPCFYPLTSLRDLGSKPAFRVDFTGPQRDHNETGCILKVQEEQKRLPFGVVRAGQGTHQELQDKARGRAGETSTA